MYKLIARQYGMVKYEMFFEKDDLILMLKYQLDFLYEGCDTIIRWEV